jgi:DNA-binding XRE family transcriptional regulator
MQFRYLPCTLSHDEATRTWCAEGQDSAGRLFGVGAGLTAAAARVALRAYILEALVGAAADGEDQTGDLVAARPIGDHLTFSPQDMLPITLRAARVRGRLRQADMAERLGMSQQAYQKLEKPGANPTLATLVRLEQAVGEELVRLGNVAG